MGSKRRKRRSRRAVARTDGKETAAASGASRNCAERRACDAARGAEQSRARQLLSAKKSTRIELTRGAALPSMQNADRREEWGLPRDAAEARPLHG